MSEKKPGRQHELLNVFVGTWKTEGLLAATEDSAEEKFHAVDIYEWMDGSFFLLHRVEATIGGQEIKALEIIGCDEAKGDYVTHSFDNQGVFETYRAKLEKNVWTIEGKTARFRGEFDDRGSFLTGDWQRCDAGGNWQPWMHVELTKQANAG